MADPASNTKTNATVKGVFPVNNTLYTAAAAVMGVAVGAAVMCATTASHRQIRRGIHQVARGAEKAMLDLDRMVEKYAR